MTTTTPIEKLSEFEVGSERIIEILVEEYAGWASSIARSVARAWNMDWQLDGLDGGAYEALLFCATRYDPTRNIPFKSYARRRIHEASTEEARRSKSWRHGVGTDSEAEQNAREISLRLLEIYPELRDSLLPASQVNDTNKSKIRSSVRQLLSSASLLASAPVCNFENPESAVDFKELFELLSQMPGIHQQILWEVYWEGHSLRTVAEMWSVDDLAVIREHKVIIEYLEKVVDTERSSVKLPKIRPVLRPVAQRFSDDGNPGPFTSLFERGVISVILVTAMFLSAAFYYYLTQALVSIWDAI